MPKVKANNITINYDQQGTGEPLILIPYLAADYACYAFQVAEYAKHFTCISIDLRGTGESDKPEGVYSTEHLDDDVAAFMQAARRPSRRACPQRRNRRAPGTLLTHMVSLDVRKASASLTAALKVSDALNTRDCCDGPGKRTRPAPFHR